MKAAVYYENGGPEVLRYEDVPDPPCPPDGVVIDVEVIGVEGGDTLHRGRTPLPRRPHIVGYQCAGTVREVGANVTNRKVGDRVVVMVPNGSHAERVAAPARSTWVGPRGCGSEGNRLRARRVRDRVRGPLPLGELRKGPARAGPRGRRRRGPRGHPAREGRRRRRCSPRPRATRSWRACASSARRTGSTTRPVRSSSPSRRPWARTQSTSSSTRWVARRSRTAWVR